MRLKSLAISCVMAATLLLAVPVAAQTFTDSQGILSIELPNENWKEMTDPTKWIVLSDGSNMLTIDHFSNGDKLPSISVADKHYVNTYQAIFSTQDEVFIITGYVVDAAKIPEISNAIISTKVLRFGTKMAKIKEAAPTPASNTGFSIVAMDANYTVNADGLNVRSNYSTSDSILGGLSAGAVVHVTGKVQQNGVDFGWYRIDYNGTSGFVSSTFLTEGGNISASASASSSNALSYTGQAKTVYNAKGDAITIYEASDGYWYDGNGNKYDWLTPYEFQSGSQSYTTNRPLGVDSTGAVTISAYWITGAEISLTDYGNGILYSPDWVAYTDMGDGTYYGADGTILFDSPDSPAMEKEIARRMAENDDDYEDDENEGYTILKDGWAVDPEGNLVRIGAGYDDDYEDDDYDYDDYDDDDEYDYDVDYDDDGYEYD